MRAAGVFLVALLVAPPVAWLTRAPALRAGHGEGASATPTAPPSADTGLADTGLAARVAALETAQARWPLAAAFEAGAARESADGWERHIRAALAERGIEMSAARTAASEPRALDPAELLARVDVLLALRHSDPIAASEGWKALAEEGATEAALAALEERAQASPEDADASYQLALGSLSAMNALSYGPVRLGFGERADAAFQAALSADPERDDIRLGRAQALAEWPSFLGKRTEAIAELELLVQRGESHGNAKARSYLLLGSLLFDQGDAVRAREVWQRGAGAFPDDADLAAALRSSAKR